MSKPRISYVDPATVKDEAMLAEFERCRREGTPRPESQAIRAHVPAAFWSFAQAWDGVFRNGVMDHPVKELCRVYVSRSVMCGSSLKIAASSWNAPGMKTGLSSSASASACSGGSVKLRLDGSYST